MVSKQLYRNKLWDNFCPAKFIVPGLVWCFLFSFLLQEFNLIDRRELAPLQDLIEKLGSKDR